MGETPAVYYVVIPSHQLVDLFYKLLPPLS